jgi:hypothetical protein
MEWRFRTAAMALVMLSATVVSSSAQPAKVFVKGSPKPLVIEVVTLLRGLPDVIPVSSAAGPDATLDLQKKGGAKVKCGSLQAHLPGPTAADLVAQLRQWIPQPVAARRTARAERSRAWAEGLRAFAEGLNAMNQARATSNASSLAAGASSTKLMIFGGQGHKTYLGCVNCSRFDPDSVENQFGVHGSRFSTTSVVNGFSEFGSKFSDHSACNRFASDPPVIVDGSGQYYGRLTVNTMNPERTRSATIQAWLAGVCSSR